jgi:hypothetical protein
LTIAGKFTTDGSHSIGFIRCGESEEGKRTTRNGFISFYDSAEIREGWLMSTNEDDPKYDKWGPSERKLGDVQIGLYLAPAQIETAIAEIKQAARSNHQIRITADLYVLAFQSEVERSLAEPYHHQTYWFKEGAVSPVLLERLTIFPVSSQPARSGLDDDSGLDDEKTDAPEPVIPFASPATEAPAAAPPRHSMKALVIALWAIAVAIVFHALR